MSDEHPYAVFLCNIRNTDFFKALVLIYPFILRSN